jgi:DnaJ-class molecular chaperone
MDYYEVLGIKNTATAEEIRKVYRQLSLKYHPDRNTDPSATEKYKEINEAYETLSDPAERQKYDMMKSMGGGMGGMDDHMPFPGMFTGNMGGPFGGGGIRIFHSGGGGGGGMGGMEGIPPELAHIFQMFGGAPPGFPGMTRPTFMKPPPINTNIQISMETVLNGGTIPISVDRWIIENGMKVTENVSMTVEIPKAIEDKETITIVGKGNMAGPNVSGDILVTIHVNNTTQFKRNGLDLIYNKKITLKESLCGFKIDIAHINGKRYNLNNSAGKVITPGHVKTLPLLGLTHPNGTTGNLQIVFDIEFPAALTEEQTEALKNII